MAYFFNEDILYNSFPILKVKFSVPEIVKRIFKKKLYLKIFYIFSKLETVQS